LKQIENFLLYGSDTWPMKKNHEVKVHRTEMSMFRWMWVFTEGQKGANSLDK